MLGKGSCKGIKLTSYVFERGFPASYEDCEAACSAEVHCSGFSHGMECRLHIHFTITARSTAKQSRKYFSCYQQYEIEASSATTTRVPIEDPTSTSTSTSTTTTAYLRTLALPTTHAVALPLTSPAVGVHMWVRMSNKACCQSQDDGTVVEGTYNSAADCKLACSSSDCHGIEFNKKKVQCKTFADAVTGVIKRSSKFCRCHARVLDASSRATPINPTASTVPTVPGRARRRRATIKRR